jgi:DNA repair exonuclease SbcCD nuclease subunit
MTVIVIFMIKINKSKVCIISDLHLGVHTNSTLWHEIAVSWAKWLSAELDKRNIKDIIFCGDWHHNRSEISVNTLQTSADILTILEKYNKIMILGNHDIYYKHRIDVNSLSIFKDRKNITIIDNIYTINAFDKTITLCPWNTSIDNIPKSDIIFGHFEIKSFKMNAYKVCEEGLGINELLDKSSLVISGHFHHRHEKVSAKGTILYVGNPFQMDFGDANNSKGAYILDLDDLKYSFIENNISPKYHKISLSELVECGKITDDIRNKLNNNIVKLKIDRNISQEDLSVLTSKLNQLNPEVLTLDYDIGFNKISDNPLSKDLSGIDITQAIAEFINLLEIDCKADILDYTLDLYNKCSI